MYSLGTGNKFKIKKYIFPTYRPYFFFFTTLAETLSAFLAHLSWKFKWTFLIAHCLASVCLSVNFYIFHFFSRTTGPILTRLDKNHPWVEGTRVWSNKRDSPSPRGDNSERVKIQWKFLNIFSRTNLSNYIKLGTNYPWIKENQVCRNKGPDPLQREDNHKNGVVSFKNLLLQNLWANFD
jgi:hypothetical protein